MANIFISYKRVDKERVFKIKDQIESALGEKCWIDLDGIESDAQFASVIIRAINEAHIVLFMYSKAHSQIENYETDWTIRELNFANEKKKRIVFLNIDNTPLTDWFRLMFGTKQQVDATSDFAINRLLKDLKMWIDEEKKKKRDAEAKRKQEEEARRLQEEQQRLINSIKQECTVLNNEETKLDLNRQNLLIRTEKIADKEQREVLRSSIVGSSPIGKKFQEQLSSVKAQIAKEREQKEQLNRSVASLQQELSEARNTHQRELEDARKAHQKELEAARQKMQHQVVNSVPTADNKKLHIIYSSVILILLIVFGLVMGLSGGRKKEYAKPSATGIMGNTTELSASQTATLPPLLNLINNMVHVEGGTFTMGATSEQGSDADDDEKPAHQVTLSSFSIGKYEVTQEEWEAVMGSNPSSFKGAKRPVEEVSWDDCQEFIRKLNALTGKQFRLPTEAEWEYAARGGNRSQGYKYAGSNSIDSVAWYNDNSGYTTHPVGQKQANELGLYDMAGNVWEWCQDWYGNYSSNSQTNPTGPSSASDRVYRGGSWSSYARYCRVSNRYYCTPVYRYYCTPVYRYYFLGLRLAL